MAYVALTSLKTTIELHFLQPIPRVSFPDDDQTPPIKSFYDNLSSLQAFLEEKFSAGAAAIKYFETILRDFATKDVMEYYQSILARLFNKITKDKDDAVNEEAASQQLCQILQQAQEKTADVVGIMNIYRRQKLFNNQNLFILLIENLSSLQDFLEEKSSAGGAAIKYFGTLIRDFALKVVWVGKLKSRIQKLKRKMRWRNVLRRRPKSA